MCIPYRFLLAAVRRAVLAPRHSRLAAAAVVLLGAVLPAQARTDAVATTGSDTGLGADVSYLQFAAPALNSAGQVAFWSRFSGTAVTAANNTAIYRNSTLVARLGDAAPDQPSAAWTFTALSSLVALNDAGQVGFGGSVGAGMQGVIYRDSTRIAQEGHQPPGLNGFQLYSNLPTAFAVNNAGQVAFKSLLTGFDVTDGVDDKAVFNGGVLARSGHGAPGAGANVFYNGFGDPQFIGPVGINNAGQVVYFSFLAGAGVTEANNRAIYRDSTLIARTGNAAPGAGAGVSHSYFETQLINDAGQVAYLSRLAGATVTAENRDAIYRGNTLLVRAGNTAPGAGAGVKHLELDHLVFNNAGQVAFNSRLTGPGVTVANASAIYRNGTLIARKGDAATFLGAGVDYQALGAPLLNHTGQVAFRAAVSGAAVTNANDWGIFIGDGTQTIKAVREGDALAFSAVVDFSLNEAGNGKAFNDHGQVAYSATLANGKSGVFLFTPDLHWRTAAGGAWDDNAHWTVGLTPAQVHDVFIDPRASLTVNGPAGPQSVRSLTVGGDRDATAVATLRLAGGTLLATEGVTIDNGGVLTGIGTIGSSNGINNRGGGTVRVQDLTLSGGLSNHGLVHGTGLVRTNLTNHADGELKVATGEAIHLAGSSHGNDGRIEVMRGSLEVTGGLRNQVGTGIIVARDATLRFNDGLINVGTLLFSLGGASHVYGPIDNRAGGEITTLGSGNVVTFHDDLLNQGNVYTGTDATLRLNGNVTGGGSFTGAGTVQFNATLSPGNSPALVSFGGRVTLGAPSRTVMELGGSVRGAEYDALDAAAIFTLGGTLDVDLLPSFNAQAGLSFDLFAAPTLRGGFASLDLPALGAGLAWNSALLIDANGNTDVWRLSISAVPEPQTWALWLAGLGVTGWRNWRRG